MTKMHQYLILKTSTNLKLPLCMKVCPTTLNIGIGKKFNIQEP